MDNNNLAQIKQELSDTFLNQINNTIPRTRLLSVLTKAINALNTGAVYTDIANFDDLKAIATAEYEDDTSGLTIQAIPVGTTIKVKINGADMAYKLVSGEEATASPFILRPDDYGDEHHVYWKLQGNEIRYRQTISSAELLSLKTTPVRLLNASPLNFTITKALFKLNAGKIAYKGNDTDNLIINNGVDLYKILVSKIMHSSDNYDFFESLADTIKNTDVDLKINSDLIDGNGTIVIDLFITIIE